MMNIKKFINGTTRVPQQVASTYLMSQMVCKHMRDPDCDESVSALVGKWLKGSAPGDRAFRSADGAVGLNMSQSQPLAPAERRLLIAHGYDIPDEETGRYACRAIVGGSIICTRQSGMARKRNSYTLFTRYGVGRVDSICFVLLNGSMRCFLFLKKSTILAPLMWLKHAWTVTDTDALMLCHPTDIHGNAVVASATCNGQDVCVCARQPNGVEKD